MANVGRGNGNDPDFVHLPDSLSVNLHGSAYGKSVNVGGEIECEVFPVRQHGARPKPRSRDKCDQCGGNGARAAELQDFIALFKRYEHIGIFSSTEKSSRKVAGNAKFKKEGTNLRMNTNTNLFIYF